AQPGDTSLAIPRKQKNSQATKTESSKVLKGPMLPITVVVSHDGDPPVVDRVTQGATNTPRDPLFYGFFLPRSRMFRICSQARSATKSSLMAALPTLAEVSPFSD